MYKKHTMAVQIPFKILNSFQFNVSYVLILLLLLYIILTVTVNMFHMKYHGRRAARHLTVSAARFTLGSAWSFISSALSDSTQHEYNILNMYIHFFVLKPTQYLMFVDG